MRVDDAGWLEVQETGLPAVVRVPSVRTVSMEEPKPLGIVWHWTAGPCRNPETGRMLADEIRTFDRTKDRAASWHVLVGKDGRIFQSVPFNVGSWHVGRPGRIGGKPALNADGKWDCTGGWAGKLYANINRVTIGVELENAGRLLKMGEKFYCWPFYLNPDAPGVPDPHMELPASRAVQVGAEWFDEFPQAQRDAAQRLT
jgi:N-acetyl-anhydromuramyl-L-alanine amidase AmpD